MRIGREAQGEGYMATGLTVFDRKFLQGVNISTDGVKLKRLRNILTLPVQPSEIVADWEDLPCKLSLEEVRCCTDLVRVITVRLARLQEQEYKDVLKQIDARIARIHEWYPGSNFSCETKQPSRVCEIGCVPLTERGVEFLRWAWDLLAAREKHLAAKSRKALESKDKPERKSKKKRLWDVTYELPMFGIRTTIRLRLDDEGGCPEDYACDFFINGKNGGNFSVKPASRQRRKIYEMKDSDTWRWKPRQKATKCSCQQRRRTGRTKTHIDVQQNIHPQRFIRQEGKKPLQGATRVTFHVPESEVAKAFGPPQIDDETLFWNFATRDGKAAFSLFAKPKGETIDLVADGNFLPAYLWASDRLVSIFHGDEQPLALSRAC
jgi:hypothetical protein